MYPFFLLLQRAAFEQDKVSVLRREFLQDVPDTLRDSEDCNAAIGCSLVGQVRAVQPFYLG